MELTNLQLTEALFLAIKRINIIQALKQGLSQHGEYYLQQAVTLATVQLQLIHNVHPNLINEQLYTLTSIMLEKIEAAGASVPHTTASTFVSDLCASIGNRWNPSSKERAALVLQALEANNKAELGIAKSLP